MPDSLGDRFKRYESVSAGLLLRRCPVIVRVDGRAFHTWTRGLGKPFDMRLVEAMRHATRWAATKMQGCKLAFTQSDEASFLLTDFDRTETEPWFGYDLAKVISITASMFTGGFIQACQNPALSSALVGRGLPEFDARAFNVPEGEVANYFLWRAKDWRRNSIQMLGQEHYSPRALHGVSLDKLLAMLQAAGHPWHELPNVLRLGSWYLPRLDEELSHGPETSFSGVSAVVEQAVQAEEAVDA